MIARLVLALAGKNVSISSGASVDHWGREAIAASITEGNELTAAEDTVRIAARSTAARSRRDNMTNSGKVARIAGDAIGASRYLPNMATDEFLACLSKSAVEKAAVAEGVPLRLPGCPFRPVGRRTQDGERGRGAQTRARSRLGWCRSGRRRGR